VLTPTSTQLSALNLFPASPQLRASTELEHHIKKAIYLYHSSTASSPKGKGKATRRNLISALLETSVEQDLDDLASLDSSIFEDPHLSDSEVLQTALRMLRGSYGESVLGSTASSSSARLEMFAHHPAPSEPLSYALATTLLLLALHPEAQAQLQAELDEFAPVDAELVSASLTHAPSQ
jgi:cytochrome P450